MNPVIPYLAGCAVTYFAVRVSKRIQAAGAEAAPKVTARPVDIWNPVKARTPVVTDRQTIILFILARLSDQVLTISQSVSLRNVVWKHEPEQRDGALVCPTCRTHNKVYHPCVELRSAAAKFLNHKDFDEEWLK